MKNIKITKTLKYLLFIIGAMFLVVLVWLVTTSSKLKALILSESDKGKTNVPVTGNLVIPNYSQNASSSNQTVVLDKILKEIEAAYLVLASDESKRLVVTQPVALTFNVDGKFNVLVKSFPVSIKQGSTLIQDLDAGDYVIKVSSGIVTIIS